MNEVLDKLFLRLITVILIGALLFLYRYAHALLYPHPTLHFSRRLVPTDNYVDSIHFFGRIIGIALALSAVVFNDQIGILENILKIGLWSVLIIFIYLLSVFLLESMVMFNFTYEDEITKRSNLAYAFITFNHSVGIGILIKSLVNISGYSALPLLILSLYLLFILGSSSKMYRLVSKLPFNKLLIQKNLGMSLSYSGFFWGIIMILLTSINQEENDILIFCIFILLKVLLGFILFPIIKTIMLFILKLSQEETNHIGNIQKPDNNLIGLGIYEGGLYFAAALITSIIIGKFGSGTIFPFFA